MSGGGPVRRSYLGAEQLEWSIGRSTFAALPEIGARLTGWSLARPDGSRRTVLHWPDLTELVAVPNAWGGNPILFPFAGRSFVAGMPLRWRDPAGAVRPMPNHGLARQGRFALEAADAAGFAARLLPDAAAEESYPFRYRFDVTYRFRPDGLACTLTLANLDRVPLPWCPGHHFYFNVPWDPAAARSDHFVRIEAERRLTLGADGSWQPVEAFPDAERLGGSASGGVSHVGLRSPVALLGRRGSDEAVQVRIDAPALDEAVAYVAWTPGPDAPFYCVEPWLGPPNAVGNGYGVRWVPPGGTATFAVSVQAD